MIESITGKTKLTGLLGSPVSHSISPMMHNEAFRLLGLDFAYLAFDVNTDSLKTAVEGLKALGVRGFNLTMPNKNLMLSYVDHMSEAASMIGAINTVVNENGVLFGYNTDGMGYMKALADEGHHIIGKKMTLLGAGGAATAVCAQAALDGVSSIDMYSVRDSFWDRAVLLIDAINKNTACKASLYELADQTSLKKSIGESKILTNGTPVGMSPHEEGCLITDSSMFHPDLIVSDVIYNPRKTRLLQMAEEKGLKTCNGLFMLLYQGAEAFRLWTLQDMPIHVIKEKYFS